MKNVYLLKYDQQLHYEWSSHVIEETDDYVLLYAGPGRTLQHHTRGACYTYDSHSLECFMRHEGFTLQLDLEHDGTMRWYSNIGLPSTMTDEAIHFVDLDLDFVTEQPNEWRLVDEEEFEINQMRYGYPDALISYVWQTVDEVRHRMRHRQFPFDGSFERRLLELSQSKTSHFR